jgi:FkbM family methyltransferase
LTQILKILSVHQLRKNRAGDVKNLIKNILYFLIGKTRAHKLYEVIFLRHEKFSEASLIFNYFVTKGCEGTLVDVGAHYGESFESYLSLNWTVLAFEPDGAKWEALNKFKKNKRFTLITSAVSNKSSNDVPFYVSPESTGISSLTPFIESHKESGHVDVVTLKDVLHIQNISNVSFLKIDTEGHDLFVLEGYPWDELDPEIILCEFEDFKTKLIGYDYRDLGQYLIQRGYSVYLSEWYPIVKYGGMHKWRRLIRYPAEVKDINAWGNFIAVSSAGARDYFDRLLINEDC